MRALRIVASQLMIDWSFPQIKWVIISAVLMFAPAFVYFASDSQKFIFLLLIVLILIVLVLLRWPPLSLAVLVVISVLSPFSIGTGTETMISANLLFLTLLIGLWILDVFILKNQPKVWISRTYIPLIILLVAVSLSFLNGQLPWYIFTNGAPLRSQIGALAMVVLAAGGFMIFSWRINQLNWLRRLTWAFVIIGTLVMLGRIIPQVNLLINRYSSNSVSHSIFWIWFVAIAFSQAMFNQQIKFHWRAVLYLLVICAFYVTLIKGRFWSSGWIPALVGLGGIVWIGIPRFRWLFLVGGGLIFILNIQRIIDFVMLENDYSFVTRMEAWRIVLEISKTSPILGLGPANYRFYTPLFPIMGYAIEFNSHNNFIDIYAQFGLIGLGLLLWFFGEVSRTGLSLVKKFSDGFVRAYLIGALGGVIGMLSSGILGDWFLPFVYNIGLSGFQTSMLGWMFLGGVVSIEHIYHKARIEAMDRQYFAKSPSSA